MFRFEIQFLGRCKDDYDRHLSITESLSLSGGLALKSYYFAGVKGLVVLVENEADRDAIVRAVPSGELVGSWDIRLPMDLAA
ncbi:MAG: hypothetical protein MI741_24505 [Rhodospirillales bacterium]|nr:hypothetical protein [Rhodospirillales bacterium]